MQQQDHSSFSQEEADLEEVLSLVGTGLASYDRLVQHIQQLGHERIAQIIHQARQVVSTAHPNAEAAYIAVSLLTACALSRRESEAASGLMIWYMRWSDRFSGRGRPESTLCLSRRTVAGWVWLVARCVEETRAMTEAELWFLPRMYRLTAPADMRLIVAAHQAGHTWLKAHPAQYAHFDLMDRERRDASCCQLPAAATQETRIIYQAAWLAGALTPPDEDEIPFNRGAA